MVLQPRCDVLVFDDTQAVIDADESAFQMIEAFINSRKPLFHVRESAVYSCEPEFGCALQREREVVSSPVLYERSSDMRC